MHLHVPEFETERAWIQFSNPIENSTASKRMGLWKNIAPPYIAQK